MKYMWQFAQNMGIEVTHVDARGQVVEYCEQCSRKVEKGTLIKKGIIYICPTCAKEEE